MSSLLDPQRKRLSTRVMALVKCDNENRCLRQGFLILYSVLRLYTMGPPGGFLCVTAMRKIWPCPVHYSHSALVGRNHHHQSLWSMLMYYVHAYALHWFFSEISGEPQNELSSSKINFLQLSLDTHTASF